MFGYACMFELNISYYQNIDWMFNLEINAQVNIISSCEIEFFLLHAK